MASWPGAVILSPAGFSPPDTSRPSTRPIASAVTGPGRSRVAPATIVDSSPAAQGPSSITSSAAAPRLATTCAARVGLMPLLRFAEGAASGRSAASISARIARCAGTRIATVSSPAVTSDAIGAPSRSGSTSVNGPGQKASASAAAVASNTASRSASARSGTWTISGLKLGRPLAA